MGSYRWLPLVLAGTLFVAACSGSNPASPGSTNPNMPGATGAAVPPSRPEAGSEKITLKGAIADARSGEGLAKATLVVQALTTDVFPTANAATGSMEASGSMTPPMTPPMGMGAASNDVAALPSVPPAPSNAGRQGASAPHRTASAPGMDDPHKPRKISVDRNGQFEIKDMEPGVYQITAYAPGYEALTIVGNRPSALNMALVPHKQTSGYEVGGTVQTAANKPAEGARIVAGVIPGLTIGDATTANNDGSFALKDLKTGKTPIAAYIGELGEIKAWALQADVPIGVGKDKKTPSPQLTLHAVTDPVIFSGKVTSPSKDLKPRQVSVQLVTDNGEVPLLTRTPDRDGYFRFALPALGEGQTYHLIASAADAEGDVVYAHKQRLNATDLKMEVALPAAAKGPKIDTTENPGSVSWEAMDDASAYRVRLETIGDDAMTVWEGYSTGTHINLPDPEIIPLLKKNEKYRLTLTAIKVADSTAYELANIGSEPWAFASSHAPLEFVYGQTVTTDPRARSASASIEPLPVAPPATHSLKPLPKAKTKARVKPATKPKAKPTTKQVTGGTVI